MKIDRKIILRAQHYLVTPEILNSTDMVLTCTKSFANKHDLAYKTLPFEVAPSQFFLAWHITNDEDPGCMWLRELIKDSFAEAKSRWH